MIQTVEAIVEANGQVRLLGAIRVNAPRRALVTILDEPAVAPPDDVRPITPAAKADAMRPRDEWEQRLLGLARPCGVSLPDSALSSEGLYES